MSEKDKLLEAWRMANVVRHINESNKIEGLLHEPTTGEISEWERFMKLDEVTVDDMKRFVYVCAGAGNRLRNLITDDHHIGGRRLKGGPEVQAQLAGLLEAINMHEINPFHAHIRYELQHPFTDGNGRSGRVLWHWHMSKRYPDSYESRTKIGFLHRFYYQTLQYSDSAVKIVS